MKKHKQMNSILKFCYSHFVARNVFKISLYSTRATAAKTRSLDDGSINKLYRMITPWATKESNVPIVPVLDRWVEEGGTLDKYRFVTIMKELKHYKRYKHALEVVFLLSSLT